MAEYIEREALLHDIEQSVVYTAKEKIPSAEMRGAHKIIERIKCAPAVEPIYIHDPTKSEFKRMAVQMGYEQVVYGRWVPNCVGSPALFVCDQCNTVRNMVDNAPTVDTEIVVRCKDCKWFANNNDGEWFGCWLFNAIRAVPEDAPTPDDFCSYGARKDDNAT